jgi:hypothetical protein
MNGYDYGSGRLTGGVTMRSSTWHWKMWGKSADGLFNASTSFWLIVVALIGCQLLAQPPVNNPPGQNGQRALIGPAGPQQNPLFPGQNNGQNANMGPNSRPRGAAANADFESLIDLIQSTIANETWAQNGGGTADIRPFPGGVLVDTGGLLRLKSRADAVSGLTVKRGAAPSANFITNATARRASTLRYVSLPRLEREIVRRQTAHQALDPAMLTLAGLRRVRYVFAYPESGDLVLAGPAGDWSVDAGGHIIATDTREPVVRLDDLLVILRRGPESADSHFGCSINPRQDALAKTQAFLETSSKKPLEPSRRKQWLSDLRDSVGRQDIDIFGIDPTSRAANVLVEADYHMKLIGMGLAEGVDGVESYLKSIRLRRGESPPAMSVLRWWFALKYDSIGRSEARDAFELVGQGVRVLSENELLAEQGQRVHTGQSDSLNRQFAEAFTAHFAELAKKYPVYGELRNIFDLAMAAALMQNENLAERVHWKPGLLVNSDRFRVPRQTPPREVETVINHRVINERFVIAGVSGGVMVAPGDVLREAKAVDSTGKTIARAVEAPKDLAAGAWWWDAK